MSNQEEANIIVVCNQKGGAGKSTVSVQLAGTLAMRKNKVLLADADPQGTAMRWVSSADEDKPFPAMVAGMGVAGGKVHRELKKFAYDYDYIIVDCPPAVDSPVPQSALMVADLALIPVIPSPPDLWAAVGIKELVARMGDINETLKARLVINMLQANTNISGDVMDALQDFDIPIAKTQIHLRTVYRQSAGYGETVHDMDNAKAIDEINKLTDEVTENLLN